MHRTSAEQHPLKATSQQSSGQSRGTTLSSRGSKCKLGGTGHKLRLMQACGLDQAAQVQACTQFLLRGFFTSKKMVDSAQGVTTTGRQRKYGQHSTLCPLQRWRRCAIRAQSARNATARATSHSLNTDLSKERFAMYTSWVETHPCNGSSKAEEAQQVRQTVEYGHSDRKSWY